MVDDQEFVARTQRLKSTSQAESVVQGVQNGADWWHADSPWKHSSPGTATRLVKIPRSNLQVQTSKVQKTKVKKPRAQPCAVPLWERRCRVTDYSGCRPAVCPSGGDANPGPAPERP